MDELAPDEIEWVETVPEDPEFLVACSECGAFNPRRNHMPQGKFSFKCPTCRRKETQRRSASKTRKKKSSAFRGRRMQLRKERQAIQAMLVGRVSREIAINNQRLEYLKAREAEGKATKATITWLRERTLRAKLLDSARRRMQNDIDAGKPKPYIAYFKGD